MLGNRDGMLEGTIVGTKFGAIERKRLGKLLGCILGNFDGLEQGSMLEMSDGIIESTFEGF